MNTMILVRRWLLALCFFALGGIALAQEQTATEYKPKAGQPGKDVVWVPTPQALVEKMLDLAKVTADDYVIDLGSGDGRIIISAAKRGARALGLEYNPDLVELSRRTAAKEGVSDKATFEKADIFATDFSQGTVITMFLLREMILKLRSKLLDMKPGTRIVSNTFMIADWRADEALRLGDNCVQWVTYCWAYLWIVPAKVEGLWRLPQGELTLKQTFQLISGTLKSNGKTVEIADGKLRGEEISFTAGEAQYTGHVNGNAMEGSLQTDGNTETWKATRVGKKKELGS